MWLLKFCFSVMTVAPNEAQWAQLRQHIQNCGDAQCGCKVFYQKFSRWSGELPVVPLAEPAPSLCGSQPTWLWFKVDKTCFSWLCLFCDTSTEVHRKSVRISNIRDHHNSLSHRQAVERKLGMPINNAGRFNHPPIEVWKELLAAFQKGGTLAAGFDLPSGRVCREKALELLWCMSEAHDDVKREMLEDSEVICIFKDERHGRLHIRFRCIGEQPHPYADYLGQSKGHSPDAIGLATATADVFRRICTSRAMAPPGACVQACFHDKLFQDSKGKIEGVCVDSAENEIVSVRDMARPKPDGSDADFKHAHHVLRDGAHSARRFLSRLFRASARLSYTFDLFFAIASIIQWSDDLRQMYSQCTAESTDAATSTAYQHLRAAKHRIESWLAPLSRCLLDPSGECQFIM